jgi:plastocyanin
MCSRTFCLPLAFLLLLTIVPAAAADEKAAAICTQAEERFVEMFGHPSSEVEGVKVVKMYKYKFCPEQLTVPVGATVRWVNVDKRTSHSVVLKDANAPESDRLFPEENFEFTFLVAGQQNYLCGPHWETQEMIGRVKVAP